MGGIGREWVVEPDTEGLPHGDRVLAVGEQDRPSVPHPSGKDGGGGDELVTSTRHGRRGLVLSRRGRLTTVEVTCKPHILTGHEQG